MEYRYAKRYPVPGLLNCRDLGGYPLPGGQTRWGLFWRSACPAGCQKRLSPRWSGWGSPL